jgi:hypothetical protein
VHGSYFWNINRWPVYQKIISGDLCNIENLQIPINITSQEKLHNLYYFGWVIIAMTFLSNNFTQQAAK